MQQVWRVAVTREAGKNGELARLLREAGAEVAEVPLIRFAPVVPSAELLATLHNWRGWLLLTSPQGAQAFLNLELTVPHARIAAVGEATAQPLRDAGLTVHSVASRAEARALAAELPAQPGEMALHLTSQLAADTLRDRLQARGIGYQRAEIYRTEPAALSASQLAELHAADVVALASGSAAKALAQAAGTDFVVAVMGQQTAQAAREAGFTRLRLAHKPSLAALAEAASLPLNWCMASDLKPTADPESTLEKLDIRLGQVLTAELEPSAPKKSYRLTIDFGKYGVRTSVGRFTQHTPAELVGQQVMGVLNFAPRQIGDVQSDVLVVGVQFKGADSGEATFLTPATKGKLGSKLF